MNATIFGRGWTKRSLCARVIRPEWDIVRLLWIGLAYIGPSKLRVWAVDMLRRYTQEFPEEIGCFRTDVAFAAYGVLRSGDVKAFEQIVAAYPFPERWVGMFPRINVAHIRGEGWRVGAPPGLFVIVGKARLQQLEF